MMNASDATLRDQASGLRQLFHAPVLTTHLITCPARAALALPLTQRISAELSEAGLTVAWIDEIDLSAREHWQLPATLRFDVGQALEGHVDLSDAMVALNPKLFYGLSCKTRKIGALGRSLQDRLLNSGVAFDAVLVAAHPQVKPSRYAAKVRHVLLTPADTTGLQHTLRWMLRVHREKAISASWGVILAGDESQVAPAREWLSQQAEPELAQSIEVIGVTAADAMHAPLSRSWFLQPDLLQALQHHLLKP